MERFRRIGTVKPFTAQEIPHSRLGIGFEKLDRDVFDPENAYDPVSKLGVKWVRIQSGWERTEKTRGVYDFAWIDSIVDNLIRRGLKPWVCLCYGNPLYSENAKITFGSVGIAPVRNDDQKQGWANYVRATVAHFRGRVEWFEVWNEPDWCWRDFDPATGKNEHVPSGTEYGEFLVATSAAVRSANPDAKVIGGCFCGFDRLHWLADVMRVPGAPEAMDAFSYHDYHTDERQASDRNDAVRALVRRYCPDMKFIQGETGTQSDSRGCGALQKMAWTQLKQAKFLARHTIMELLDDVFFTSYFSSLDMIEALHGKVGDLASYLDFGYFGVLGAEFDAEGRATGTYTPKKSYYALRNVCSLFRGDFSRCDLPIGAGWGFPDRRQRYNRPYEPLCDLMRGGFQRPDGSCAFVYWKPTELLTSTWESDIRLETADLAGTPHLVDVLDGNVYEIPESLIEDHSHGNRVFTDLPVRDYPLMLTFGDFAEVEPLKA